MDNSNIREYELNYSLDKFGAYVNNNTGRLLLDIPVTSIGMNSYYCNVNLVYNSKYSNYSFFDRQIGFNNGFKLNIEQHIFSYREEYNIPEFTEEDYVYIDSEYRIHRFTKPLYSTGNMYYDKTNGNLYLYVNSDNTFKMTDDNDNEFYFDTNGRLVRMVSNTNNNIEKKIKYENNVITEYYDNRKINMKIKFSYNEGALDKIYDTFTNINYKFIIDNEKLLIKKMIINDEEIVKSKEVLVFSKLGLKTSIFDCESNEGLEFTFTSGTNKVSNVKSGIGDKEYLTESCSENYVGEDEYLGEDLYLSNTYNKITGYNYVLKDSFLVSCNTINYYDNCTKVTNKENITICYFLNSLRETVGIFEEESSYRYKSIEKQKGELIQCTNGTSNYKINGHNFISVNKDSSFKYVFTNEEIELINFNINTPLNMNIDFYNLTFYVRTNHDHINDLKFKLFINDKYIETTIIGKAKAGTIYNIGIPFNFRDYYSDYNSSDPKLFNMHILVEGLNENESILLNEVRMSITQIYETYINHVKLTNESLIRYLYNGPVAHKVSSDFYMTSRDIYNTFKNIYNKSTKYNLSLCNGTKLIEVYDSSIATSGSYSSLNIDGTGLTNYKVTLKELIDVVTTREVTKKLKFSKDINNKLVVYEIESSKVVNNNGLNETIYENEVETEYVTGLLNYRKVETKTTVNDSSGEENISVKESVIQKEIEYDSYGNKLLERMTYPYNNKSQTIDTSYDYEETNDNLLKVSITKEGVTVSNVYDYNGKLVESIDSKIKKEYTYDDYGEIVTNIKFIDIKTNNEIDKNKVALHKNNISEISNLKGLNYKFKSNYYDNINKVYKNNNRIKYNALSYSNDNNYIMKEKYYNKSNNIDREIEKENIIDKYSLLLKTKIGNNDYATYVYDNTYTSKYGSVLKSVSTDYALYEYKYDDLYDQITEYVGNKYHVVNDSFDSQSITLVENNIQIKQAIDSASATIDFYNEAEGTFNYLSELKFYYDFDEVGRFKSKKWNIIDKEKYLEKELLYKDNSNKLDKIKYNFKLHNNKKDYSFDYTYFYDDYNNISKVIESKCETTWRNEDIVNQLSNKTYIYEYDNLNRLFKEKVDNDIYNYEYDLTNGELYKVKLNGNLIKQFTYENDQLTKYIDKDNKVHDILYDKQGNMIKIGDKALTYDELNRLESITYTINDVHYLCSYVYNYKGELVRKEIIKTNSDTITEWKVIDFYVHNGIILGEDVNDLLDDSIDKYRYFYDKEGITAMQYNDSIYNFVKDALGNVTKVIHEGEVVGEYSYDAWGNVTEKEFEDISDDEKHVLENNPFRYRGYYYDVKTQLFYCNSRYYSPELCRFISPDSIEYLDPQSINGLNLYAYCMNNPIMYADPSGHFLISTAVALGFWIGLGIGAIAGVTLGGIFAYNLAKENGAEGFTLFGFTMLGIILGGVSGAIIGATVGSIIGYGIGLLWGTAPIAGSNGSIALWSGGNGAAAKAATDFATKTGAKIVSQTFAGKTLSFASHFIPKTLSNYFWGNLSAEFVAGAASATIYLSNPGIAAKSVFYTYEIWVLLEQGIERTIYYV